MALPTTGASRTGAPRTGTRVQASTPRLDAAAKWLASIQGVHTVDLIGISQESRDKIAYGLEAHGRPVTPVTPYMIGRLVARAQSYLQNETRPTKDSFWRAVDREALGVIIERVANAGGDLRAVWASKPLDPEYARRKAKLYPGKPMGQASGALLSNLRSASTDAVTTGGKR
jgi:hypothetical protein